MGHSERVDRLSNCLIPILTHYWGNACFLDIFLPLLLILLLTRIFSEGAERLGQPATVGVAMSNRGAVELIVLSIAAEAGLFALSDSDHLIVSHLFSALVMTVVATTFITVIVLKRVLPKSAT